MESLNDNNDDKRFPLVQSTTQQTDDDNDPGNSGSKTAAKN